jgi:hypothetical protein
MNVSKVALDLEVINLENAKIDEVAEKSPHNLENDNHKCQLQFQMTTLTCKKTCNEC